MSAFPFGAHVVVVAEALPIYGTVRERMEPTFAGSMISQGTGEYDLGHDSFSLRGQPVQAGDDGGWPGQAVPDEDGAYDSPYSCGLEPSGGKECSGSHRRIRRMGLPDSPEGVVVGTTVRHEGKYGHALRGTWDDYDPPYLSTTRRVPVVQVALRTDRGPARVIDAWTGDVREVSA